MSLVEFAEFLVKSLAQNADLVKVQQFETEEGLVLEILVSEADMGRVIGKGGKIALSLRTLIQAKAYNEKIHNVRINIDSF
ncbi:MAG: KH domain-containing protein [Bacilli bacterium]